MKSSSAESPRQRRKFSKPVMEKRRRERINQSLETLRLLMLENTNNEKWNNPKVEKAEILESVVRFLKTKKDVEANPRPEKRAPRRQSDYQAGMRSCLLRVSHFISSQNPEPRKEPSSPGSLHRALLPSPALSSPQQHHHHHLTQPILTQCPVSSLAASSYHTDPVWRPWPQ